MKKRLYGFFYCVFLMKPLHTISYAVERAQKRIEKDDLKFCVNGCENCYKWKCAVRDKNLTPYKKFRRGKFEWEE